MQAGSVSVWSGPTGPCRRDASCRSSRTSREAEALHSPLLSSPLLFETLTKTMATAAAAAAAGRRISSLMRSSPSGALHLLDPARAVDQVGSRFVGKRSFSTQKGKNGAGFLKGSMLTPSGALHLRVPARAVDQVGPRFVGKRSFSTQKEKNGAEFVKRGEFTQEEKESIAKLVAGSSELLKLRLQVKYYKTTAWAISGVIGTLVLSVHEWSSEVSELRRELGEVRSQVSTRGEEQCPCVHHHHHHLHPSPSTTSSD